MQPSQRQLPSDSPRPGDIMTLVWKRRPTTACVRTRGVEIIMNDLGRKIRGGKSSAKPTDECAVISGQKWAKKKLYRPAAGAFRRDNWRRKKALLSFPFLHTISVSKQKRDISKGNGILRTGALTVRPKCAKTHHAGWVKAWYKNGTPPRHLGDLSWWSWLWEKSDKTSDPGTRVGA